MTYSEFEDRWRVSGGAERANYGLFLQDLCDLLQVPRPNPTTDRPAEDAYVLERAVQFNDGAKKSTGRIDLYKRGCFVLETKQGVGNFAGLNYTEHRAQSTEHRAQSTEHRAQSTEHRAQKTKGVNWA